LRRTSSLLAKDESMLKWFLVSVAFLITFSGTAYAMDDSWLDMAKPILDAVSNGQYIAAAALAVILGVAVLKKYGSARWPFLATDAGGSLLVLGASAAGAFAASIKEGVDVSWNLAWGSLMIAVTAAGGYSLFKRLVVGPVLRPLADKAPGWMKPILQMVLWIFDRPDVQAEAEAAGDKAVAESPGEGLGGIVGESEKIN
jgi:hypothetical protein